MTHRKRHYLTGALAARDFLRRTQTDLHAYRQFRPKALRWEFAFIVGMHPPEYRAGFLDAIGAYLLTTLEGVLVDPDRWELLDVLEREEN
ncbi:hypothetical protein [Ralstonia sp. SET104]|uniref:hypothetical protein n=1 Tax=Ralstonia sp. SET104 TaxID=2448774 RepID=UPI000F57ECB5|nr:hypothetical protein [Ralstonia sp. SET104]GCB05343.1 hypothetical protein PSUB009319_29740 [Ralstonia sp. SET104]